ncbi:hypothetical protein HW532_17505 [Kaustia mangrovi]|uniref:Uncharacterized protein n=1 Tax=Kaustia mangrovi TaxID=2593653 RepID=A0A7S8HD27_9HYPH|nr:hypothetical protein [Kaustia mangrovi]QPC44337.1 hypothetical protein HW532_17505 [Kaustia mangrovi]
MSPKPIAESPNRAIAGGQDTPQERPAVPRGHNSGAASPDAAGQQPGPSGATPMPAGPSRAPLASFDSDGDDWDVPTVYSVPAWLRDHQPGILEGMQDTLQRQHLVNDHRRGRVYEAFGPLRTGALDGVFQGDGAPLSDLAGDYQKLKGEVSRLDKHFREFIAMRRQETNEPVKSALLQFFRPGRDTTVSRVAKESHKVLTAVATMSVAQAATAAILSRVIDTLPQSVEAELRSALSGEGGDACPESDGLAKAIAAAPVDTLDRLDQAVNRQMAEEMLASEHLSAEHRAFFQAVCDTLDSYANPPSTFLNEVTAQPWQVYLTQAGATVAKEATAAAKSVAEEATAAAEAAVAKEATGEDTGAAEAKVTWAAAVKSACADILSNPNNVALAVGTVFHLMSRGVVQGEWATAGKEFALNAAFTIIGDKVNTAIKNSIQKCVKGQPNSEVAGKIGTASALAVTGFVLKTLKMLAALGLNGKSIDALGGVLPALARNAGVTALPMVLNTAASMVLEKWYEHSADGAKDRAFTNQVPQVLKAVHNLAGKLSGLDGAHAKEALGILEVCKEGVERGQEFPYVPGGGGRVKDLSRDFRSMMDIWANEFARNEPAAGDRAPLMEESEAGERRAPLAGLEEGPGRDRWEPLDEPGPSTR